eukprot:scaffold200421_cov36-Prasinocladus_malaysianus.AAC.2
MVRLKRLACMTVVDPAEVDDSVMTPWQLTVARTRSSEDPPPSFRAMCSNPLRLLKAAAF